MNAMAGPSRRTAAQQLMLERMRRFDSKGHGCYASLDVLRSPGKNDPNPERSNQWSKSQARRILAQLRQAGDITYAGPSAGSRDMAAGTNIYLFPDRRYDPASVPVSSRIPPLWSTDKATSLYTTGEAPTYAERTLFEGYPVNQRLLRAYTTEVIRAAIAEIRRVPKYADGTQIRCHARLLEFFCNLVHRRAQKAQKQHMDRLAEQDRIAQQERAARRSHLGDASAEIERVQRELGQFLKQHPKTFLPPGSPQAPDGLALARPVLRPAAEGEASREAPDRSSWHSQAPPAPG